MWSTIYVGSTTTKFRLRFNNHKSRVRAHSTMSAANKAKDDTIYKHFHSDEHHGLRDIEVQLGPVVQGPIKLNLG